jgi:hypothetical protein
MVSSLTERTLPNRNYLLDPAYGGFFYRTDANLIEQWELWEDDRIPTRPHPPDSPFGEHQGLYHDDRTSDMHRYRRHMDADEQSTSSSSQYSHLSSIKHERTCHLVHSRSQTIGAFDPSCQADTNEYLTAPLTIPIVIEKELPNPIVIERSETRREHSISPKIKPVDDDNESIGRDCLVLDNQLQSNSKSKQSTHRRQSRSHKNYVPVVNIESLESLFDQTSIQSRKRSRHRSKHSIEKYFGDTYQTGTAAQKLLDRIHSSGDHSSASSTRSSLFLK